MNNRKFHRCAFECILGVWSEEFDLAIDLPSDTHTLPIKTNKIIIRSFNMQSGTKKQIIMRSVHPDIYQISNKT